ncbi:hypothetical protein RFI_19656, partial [Reticulomyxa filosa]
MWFPTSRPCVSEYIYTCSEKEEENMEDTKQINKPKKKKKKKNKTERKGLERESWGSVRRDHAEDEQLIKGIDESFYKQGKNCVLDILESLPNANELTSPLGSDPMEKKTEEMMNESNGDDNINNNKDNDNNNNNNNIPFREYLEKQISQCELYHSAIERLFKKQLLKNSKEFLSGMRQIREVQFDLRLTESKCTNSRTVLSSVDKSLVTECLQVISIYQHRKRTVKTYSILCEIQKLFAKEQTFNQYLNETNQLQDFVKAIQIHKELKEALSKYQNVSCLEKMRIRFG